MIVMWENMYNTYRFHYGSIHVLELAKFLILNYGVHSEGYG